MIASIRRVGYLALGLVVLGCEDGTSPDGSADPTDLLNADQINDLALQIVSLPSTTAWECVQVEGAECGTFGIEDDGAASIIDVIPEAQSLTGDVRLLSRSGCPVGDPFYGPTFQGTCTAHMSFNVDAAEFVMMVGPVRYFDLESNLPIVFEHVSNLTGVMAIPSCFPFGATLQLPESGDIVEAPTGFRYYPQGTEFSIAECFNALSFEISGTVDIWVFEDIDDVPSGEQSDFDGPVRCTYSLAASRRLSGSDIQITEFSGTICDVTVPQS